MGVRPSKLNGDGCFHPQYKLTEWNKCDHPDMPPPINSHWKFGNGRPSPGSPSSSPGSSARLPPWSQPPPPVANMENRKTLVRLTVGSHEVKQFGGGVPSVALFSEFGQRIGETASKVNAPAGSYKDVVILHKPEHAAVRPSYLLLQGGKDAICITSVGLEYPDGSKQYFTGSDLDMCHRLSTEDSRTYTSYNAAQPKCFWLHASNTAGIGVRRMSLHLPDFVWTHERTEAYTKNKDLACRATPRFFSQNGHGEKPHLSSPIPIFNPPMEYDSKTNFDRYPERNLKWHLPATVGDWKHEWSDVPWKPLKPYHPKRRIRSEGRVTDAAGYTDEEIAERIENLDGDTVDFAEGLVEMEQVRAEPPHLVISDGDISAQLQCLWGEWDHIDYVSLSERIYCDMQSRTMFPVCANDVTNNCWNPETRNLQKFARTGRYQHIDTAGKFEWNGTATGLTLNQTHGTHSWAQTGPLFGYSYSNVSLIG